MQGLQVIAESKVALAAAETDASGAAILQGSFTEGDVVDLTVRDPTGRFQTHTQSVAYPEKKDNKLAEVQVQLQEVQELVVRCASQTVGVDGLEVRLQLGAVQLGQATTNEDGVALFRSSEKARFGADMQLLVSDPAHRYRQVSQVVGYSKDTTVAVEMERQREFRFRVDTTEAGGPGDKCQNVRIELWDEANASVYQTFTSACVTSFNVSEEAARLRLGGRAVLEVEAANALLFQRTLSVAAENTVTAALRPSRMSGWAVALICVCLVVVSTATVGAAAGVALRQRKLRQVVMQPQSVPIGMSSITFDQPSPENGEKRRFAI